MHPRRLWPGLPGGPRRPVRLGGAGSRHWPAAVIAAAGLATVVAGSSPGLAAGQGQPAWHGAALSRAAVLARGTTPGTPASGSALLAAFGMPMRAELARAPGSASGTPRISVRLYRACVKAVPPPPPNQPSASTFQAGYADAAKIGEAAIVGVPVPGVIHLPVSDEFITVGGHTIFCGRVSAVLDYRGRKQLPPVRATFLAFGVEPVTATAILTQQTRGPLTAIVYTDEGPHADTSHPSVAVTTARFGLRITDVSVDGRPLDVGPRCHAVGSLYTPGNPIAPGAALLTGGNRFTDHLPHFGATLEGSLDGLVTIPPFANCVTPSGENLAPLLTASVSGPGNYVKLAQGFGCQAPNPNECTQFGLGVFPEFTVKRGGRFHAAAPLSVIISNSNTSAGFMTITCAASKLSGVFHDTSGPLRGALAKLLLSRIRGCTGDDGSRWQVAVHGTEFYDGLLGIDSSPGGPTVQVLGNIDNISLVLTGTGTGKRGTCRAVLTGFNFTSYTNAGSVFSLAPDGPGSGEGQLDIGTSTCPDVPLTWTPNGGPAMVTATYNLVPRGTRIKSP